MSPRERILARARSAARRAPAHPGVHPGPGRRASWTGFAERLRRAGGEPLGPVPALRAGGVALELLERTGVRERVLASAGAADLLGDGPWRELDPQLAPADCARVHTLFLLGALAVSEDAAVGLLASEGRPRGAAFLCENLVLVVRTSALLPDLHAAFARLPAEASAAPHFTWIAGPSKTADIERTLVLGAHGPRRLAVLGIDDA